jgi:hypothetical protein
MEYKPVLRTDVSSVAADSDPKDSVHYLGDGFMARKDFVGVHQANANKLNPR